jgi:hypothetical protein
MVKTFITVSTLSLFSSSEHNAFIKKTRSIGTSVMEANQNTTNANEKKDILPIENLIICEILFCGLATGVLTSL